VAIWVAAAVADHHHIRFDCVDELLRTRRAAAVMRGLQDHGRQQVERRDQPLLHLAADIAGQQHRHLAVPQLDHE